MKTSLKITGRFNVVIKYKYFVVFLSVGHVCKSKCFDMIPNSWPAVFDFNIFSNQAVFKQACIVCLPIVRCKSRVNGVLPKRQHSFEQVKACLVIVGIYNYPAVLLNIKFV